MAQDNSSLPVNSPYPEIIPPQLSVVGGTDSEQDENEPAIQIKHDDGTVTVSFGGDEDEADDGPEEKEFDENLALDMDSSKLAEIASDLLEGIDRDNQSRKEWLETRALGIGLLGLKLEKPRTDAQMSTGAVEGQSTVRHPLLLEATVSFQATARAELLPSSGPVKVRNDATIPPKELTQTSAAQDLSDSLQTKDDLAQALEKDMYHYLTSTAKEYVPDTDRMLFYVGFGGDGFKKVYNCPLRRRPVSESIDAEDIVVSNSATDMQNCPRVSHRIMMRKSTLKRMQILGVYRDVELAPPPPPVKTSVDKKKAEVAGASDLPLRPQDRDYEIYESYCELDLDEYAPKEFKGKGLPLPYRVTLEKASRQVLDIRRNWKEDDDQCLPKQFFVQFPFIRGLGFYGLGYIHLLGNLTNALTAGVREMLDAGMFANFPGFLYAKGAGRQLTNQFRVPPGGGVAIDIGSQQSIKDAIMALPYKEPGQAMMALLDKLGEDGRRLASTGNANVGEGKQDAPVGTTIALIEQASKVMDSAHKRLHAAQAEEFALLKERFREDPEAFWRHNKKPTIQWKKDQFIQALNSCELVPVADPNNPTSLHRIAKAMAIKELQKASPDLYDPTAVDMRIMRIVDIDPQGLFRATPAQPPPDPRMEAIKAKAQGQQQQNQIQLMETQIKAKETEAKMLDAQQDRASKERLAQLQIQLAEMKIHQEQIIHQYDQAKSMAEIHAKTAGAVQELHHNELGKAQELHHANLDKAQELQHSAVGQQAESHGGVVKGIHEIGMDRERHNAEMQRAHEKHTLDMEHAREMHAAKLEAAKALAKVKKAPAKKANP
jgi:hypothetical protein